MGILESARYRDGPDCSGRRIALARTAEDRILVSGGVGRLVLDMEYADDVQVDRWRIGE